ncbi:MAG TPA: helix-turn-helix domain-containing protein [Steroidobacter sp.]|jgi:HTH-type transcriptional regulator/antitoxin HipB|nr:helix-turn-helix domain-containing protein [Steroidobacteraceae bacterium]HLS83014.1 helix-turn-helix domain-containing protein [Steroidobacter sp.]
MSNIPKRTVRELGALMRDRRLELELSQEQLADLLGVQREWVIRLEAGNEGAELGLVLQTFEVLRLDLTLTPTASYSDAAPSPVNEVF